MREVKSNLDDDSVDLPLMVNHRSKDALDAIRAAVAYHGGISKASTIARYNSSGGWTIPQSMQCIRNNAKKLSVAELLEIVQEKLDERDSDSAELEEAVPYTGHRRKSPEIAVRAAHLGMG